MKNKDNKGLRILAGVLAIVLILGILLITSAFVGNPISSRIARNNTKEYISNNYNFLNLQMEDTLYNFKDGSYVTGVYSNTNIDTRFNIYYRRGKISDDYNSRVLGMFNTIQRLSQEYSRLISNIISNRLGYKDEGSWVSYSDNIYENSKDIIELDMKFHKDLPLYTEVTINISSKDNTLEMAAGLLETTHKTFIEEGYIFNQYGLLSQGEKKSINIYQVKPTDIEGGNLLNLLKEALETEESKIDDEVDKEDSYPGIIVYEIEK